jgi:hypothetical protein
MNNEELILATIKKVYAIREAAEKRAAERLSTPLVGYVRVALSGTSLSKDQLKDVAAYVTASCNTGEKLNVMDKISQFKAKTGVHKPRKFLLSYAGLLLPMLLAIVAEAALYLTDRLNETVYDGLAVVLIVIALALGILLYSYFSYDPAYRRDALEHEVWRAVHRECARRIKQGGIKEQKQLPPALEDRPVAPVPAPRQAVGRRKL